MWKRMAYRRRRGASSGGCAAETCRRRILSVRQQWTPSSSWLHAPITPRSEERQKRNRRVHRHSQSLNSVKFLRYPLEIKVKENLQFFSTSVNILCELNKKLCFLQFFYFTQELEIYCDVIDLFALNMSFIANTRAEMNLADLIYHLATRQH